MIWSRRQSTISSRGRRTSFLSGDNDGRENTFIIRGFEGAPVLRDGFRLETFGGIMDPEIYGLERIEVLKGPDSILYGESNPGGLINLISKRPLKQRHLELELAAGSFGSVSTLRRGRSDLWLWRVAE
jgi:iron complex outermembrane recepter protein